VLFLRINNMEVNKKKYHYIYKTTCCVNGKYYIGMHSTYNLDDGYLGSGKIIRNSIKYYGKDKHIKEIIEFCTTRDELKKREEEIVNEQLINEELCLNLKNGGQGGFTLEATKNGRKITDQILKSKYGENFRKVINENYWFKINNDEKLKNELINKIKEGQKNFNHKTFLGKKHTEESRKKISEKAKQRVGVKSSQYGTCWITRGGDNKKIKKEELPEYLTQGWVVGRKINN